MTQEELKMELEELAVRFSEGWHEGIKIDASDIMLLNEAAQALAQPEQEPVAWLDGPHLVVRSDMRDRLNYKGPWVDLGRAIPDKWTPLLFTAPPQRTWVGLTDEEIEQGCKESWVTEQAWQSAVWWAEAKLKEKNT